MSISSIHIRNFKGVSNPVDIPIKPITVFFGENSSGKSSCIHAMAALAQTMKITNNDSPIILDDEYANVHLGRFIEVIHSKSYSDTISLGISLDSITRTVFTVRESEKKSGIHTQSITHPADIKLTYSCTKKTQDIQLDSIQYEFHEYGSSKIVKKSSSKYELVNNNGTKIGLIRENSLNFVPDYSSFTVDSPMEYIQYDGIQNEFRQAFQNILYLGPFRQSPQRRYPTHGSNPTEVGSMGEMSVTMLANEFTKRSKRPHAGEVSEWLGKLGLGKSVVVSRIGKSDLFDASMTMPDGVSLPLADLGYGISQVLPVLVQCSYAPRDSVLLFEQPELHLHQNSARQLPCVFLDTYRSKNCRIVVETHSREFVGQLQVLLRNNLLTLDEVAIYRVRRQSGCTSISEVEIDREDFDIFESWTDGVCD